MNVNKLKKQIKFKMKTISNVSLEMIKKNNVKVKFLKKRIRKQNLNHFFLQKKVKYLPKII